MAKEAATAKDAQFLIISILPDVCFTPKKPPYGVPVPYPITHKMDKSKQCSSNVFFKGKPAYLHEASYVENVTGDMVRMNRGNTVGMIVPKTMPAPSKAPSNPPVMLETQAERDFAAVEATIDSGLHENVSASLDAVNKLPFAGANENGHTSSKKIGKTAKKLQPWKIHLMKANGLQNERGGFMEFDEETRK